MIPSTEYLVTQAKPEQESTGLSEAWPLESRWEMGQGRWKPQVEKTGIGRRHCVWGLEVARRVSWAYQYLQRKYNSRFDAAHLRSRGGRAATEHAGALLGSTVCHLLLF